MHNDVSLEDIEAGSEPRPAASVRMAKLRAALLVSLIALGGVLTVAWVGFLVLLPISKLGLL